MKIVKLTSENIKKLKAVEIEPTEALVKITGKNAQGKTSVLDSILYALAGKKAIPEMPIRNGEENAKITLDLGEIVVERSFTQNNSYLKVTTKEGAEYPKAQEKLSGLVKNISFDPLEFANKNSSEQVNILTALLGIHDQLAEIDREYEESYSERTVSNRKLKDATAKLNVEKPEDKYFTMEKIDIASVSDELESEREKYQTIKTTEADIEEVNNEIKDLEESIKKCRGEKDRLEKLKVELDKEFDMDKGKQLKEKLDSATEINEYIMKAEAYKQQEEEVHEMENESKQWDDKIKDNRERRAEIIGNSEMPIENLGINMEGIVTYNDIPFDQLSGAERLKVSLSVAMAMNPELRVIRILDGSLLDEDNLQVIGEMAKENDYQVWIEIVDSTGEVGFYIEEGELKNI
jgi:DNA repair exonuclease SbcCD ATPase subunit